MKKCSHNKAYFFHDNAPQYCPTCGNYIDGGEVVVKGHKKDEERI